MKFSSTKIARMLGISRQTLYRRLEEYGIPCSDYNVMIPNDLDRVNKLVGQGIRVTRCQLRSSIHRVDHENTRHRVSGAASIYSKHPSDLDPRKLQSPKTISSLLTSSCGRPSSSPSSLHAKLMSMANTAYTGIWVLCLFVGTRS